MMRLLIEQLYNPNFKSSTMNKNRKRDSKANRKGAKANEKTLEAAYLATSEDFLVSDNQHSLLT